MVQANNAKVDCQLNIRNHKPTNVNPLKVVYQPPMEKGKNEIGTKIVVYFK